MDLNSHKHTQTIKQKDSREKFSVTKKKDNWKLEKKLLFILIYSKTTCNKIMLIATPVSQFTILMDEKTKTSCRKKEFRKISSKRCREICSEVTKGIVH